jgi:hypothetical protein
MKKCIGILAVFFISGVVTLHGKKITHLISEKPENKTVRFSVFAGTDYSGSLYKKTKTKVNLTIVRFSNDKQEIVWEGVVDEGRVKNYPSMYKPLYKQVRVYNVYDRNQTLAAYYEVVYESKGSRMSYMQGITLSRGSKVDSLQISI